MRIDRPSYPSDVSDEEWASVAPLHEDLAQREVFDGVDYIVKTGAP